MIFFWLDCGREWSSIKKMEVLCVFHWKWISPCWLLTVVLWSFTIYWSMKSAFTCYLISCSELVRLYEGLLPQRFSIADCNSILPLRIFFRKFVALFCIERPLILRLLQEALEIWIWREYRCSRCYGGKSASEIPLCHWSRRNIYRYSCEEKWKWGFPVMLKKLNCEVAFGLCPVRCRRHCSLSEWKSASFEVALGGPELQWRTARSNPTDFSRGLWRRFSCSPLVAFCEAKLKTSDLIEHFYAVT